MSELKIEVRRNEDGSLDEVVAQNCNLHIEQMSEDCWWFAIYPEEGKRLSVFMTGKIEVDLAEDPAAE